VPEKDPRLHAFPHWLNWPTTCSYSAQFHLLNRKMLLTTALGSRCSEPVALVIAAKAS